MNDSLERVDDVEVDSLRLCHGCLKSMLVNGEYGTVLDVDLLQPGHGHGLAVELHVLHVQDLECSEERLGC